MRHLILQALPVLLFFATGKHAFTRVAPRKLFPTSTYRSKILLATDKVGVDNGSENPEKLDMKQEDGRKHDMTDRFRYSVNAMMGTFDPSGADDERQSGNILKGSSFA
jgi:hypothetical protein